MVPSAADETGEYDPAGAFGAISNEVRIDILLAFIEEQRRLADERDGELSVEGFTPTLSFSELLEAVGIEDSGRFNYHLDQLTGRYVTETEDGYTITWAGIEVAGSILAGGFGEVEVEQTEVDRQCPSCGADLLARYDRGIFMLQCGDSGDLVLASGVPAGVLQGRSLEAATDVAVTIQDHVKNAATRGFCPVCYGDVEIRVDRSTPDDVVTDADVALHGTCDRCGNLFLVPVVKKVLSHPAVVALYHEHGIDPRERYREGFEPTGQSEPTSVVSEDPFRVEVTIEVDEDRLVLTVDESGTVIDTERE